MNDHERHLALAAACERRGIEARDARCFQDRAGTIRMNMQPLPAPELRKRLEGWLDETPEKRAVWESAIIKQIDWAGESRSVLLVMVTIPETTRQEAALEAEMKEPK